MIKVTFEYATVDEAIVAMAKLVGSVPAKVAGRVGSVVSENGTSTPAQPSTRRGRSDKGQARGSYKNQAQTNANSTVEAGTATTVGSGVLGGGNVATTDIGKAAEQAANLISTTATPPPLATEPAAPAVKDASGGDKPVSDVTPAAAAHTVKDLQEAIGKVFNTKGLPVALQVLSRFGANTYRDIKPEQCAEFIKHATFVSEGGAV